MAEINSGTVKSWLLLYQSGERTIDNEIERLDTLETRLGSVSSPQLDGMPHGSPVQDRIGAMLAQKEELSGRIRSMIEAQTNLRHEIERCVEQLRSADEKAVILMRYVDNEKWADISQLLFGGKEDFLDREDSFLRRTTKIHKRALEDLAEIMKADCPSDSRQDDP